MVNKFNADILLQATNKFQTLVKQAAQEVDSTMVTMAVRPAVNNSLTKIDLNNKLAAIIQNAANKLANADKELHGDLKITNVITDATRVGNAWKAKSQLVASGKLLQDPVAGPAIQNLLRSVNAALSQTVASELNRLSSNLAGDKITQNDVDINAVEINI